MLVPTKSNVRTKYVGAGLGIVLWALITLRISRSSLCSKCGFCIDSQLMPLAGVRSRETPSFQVSGRPGPAEKEARKDPGFSHETLLFLLLISLVKRTACLTVSYIKCKANNLRNWWEQTVMRCDFCDKPPRLSRWISRLGDRAICWQRDSGSTPENSAGSHSGFGVVNGFTLTSKHSWLFLNCLCKRLRIPY